MGGWRRGRGHNSTLCPGTPEPSPKSMTNKFQKSMWAHT